MSQPAPGWPAITIPQTPYGHIVAASVPDGAEVYIDGQPIFDSVGRIVTTPVTLLGVATGIRRITFRKTGYFDEDVYVYVENGLYSDAYAVLRLHMATNLQPKQQGIVHFDTSPHGAQIFVDGQILVDPNTEESIKTPASVLLYEGRRDFTLQLENHYPVSGYVDVFAGARVDIFKNLTPIPGSNIRSASLYENTLYDTFLYEYQYGLGDIFIDSTPRGAFVYVDNIPQSDTEGRALLTPIRITGVMQGLHEVQISLDGYYSKKIFVNVIPDRLNIAYAKLEPIGQPIQPAGIYMDSMQPKQYGIVYFDSDPRQANIYVDGQILVNPDTEESLRTPARALLVEGRRDFTLSLEGYEDATGYVDVLPGVTVNIYKRLRQGTSGGGWGKPQQQWFIGQQQQPGIIKAYSFPDGASVYIDGRFVGNTPLETNVTPGAHRVTFKMQGMMDEEKIVDVHPGAWSPAQATMRPVITYLYSQPLYSQPEQTGNVVIQTYPDGAIINMDGHTVVDADTNVPLKTPVELVMYMGLHNLVFSLSGYCDEFATVYVEPGSTQYVHNNFNICR